MEKRDQKALSILKLGENDLSNPHGCYKLQPKNSKEGSKLLKVIPKNALELHRSIRELQDILQNFGDDNFRIIPLLEEIKFLEQQSVGLVYEYVEHNYFSGIESELEKIIHAVGKLHMVFNSNLKDLSKFSVIARRNGKLMNHELFELFKNFPYDLQIPKDIRDFIVKNFISYTDYYESKLSDSKSCALVHGDLNLGNIIFEKGNSVPIILDFEDAAISWLPQNTDIAYIIQRFLLVRNKETNLDKTAKRIQKLLNEYEKATNKKAFAELDELWDTLRFLSLRALGRLCLNVMKGIPIKKTELNKFVKLHAEAEGLHDAYSQLRTYNKFQTLS